MEKIKKYNLSAEMITEDNLEKMWQRIIYQALKDIIDSKTSDDMRLDAMLFVRAFYLDAAYYVRQAKIDIEKLNKLVL